MNRSVDEGQGRKVKNNKSKSVMMKRRYCMRLGSVVLMLVLVCCESQPEHPTPVITSFSPTSGVAATADDAGTTVTLTGKNFSATLQENKVYFQNTEAVVLSGSKTQLEVAVPMGAATGKIKVVVGSQAGTSSNNFEVIEPPLIADFTPKTGIAGDEITITGQRLVGLPGSALMIRFNGVAVTEILEATETRLRVKVPAAATSGKLSVSVNGYSGYSAQNFAIPDSPFIEVFAPVKGFAGDEVTIQGDHFDAVPGNNEVRFNGVLAIVSQASVTQLIVQVPAGDASGKITVKTRGQVTQSTEVFQMLTPVSVTSFEPTAGVIGTEVTLTGDGFSLDKDENEVLFNDIVATVLSATANAITVVVPDDATDGQIRVRVFGKEASTSADFDVWAVPTITRINQQQFGLVGSSVTLIGTDFDPTPTGNVVRFNGVEAIVQSATKTSITAIVPPCTQGRITVRAHGLTGTSANDFAPNRPQVIQEVENGLAGSSMVLLTMPLFLQYNILGFDWFAFITQLKVKFNGVEGQVLNDPVSYSPMQRIQVLVPASSTGKITLEQFGVVIAISELDFEYLKPYPFNNVQAYYQFTDDFSNGMNALPFNGTELGYRYADKPIPVFTRNRFGNDKRALSFDGNQATQTNKPIMVAGSSWSVSCWLKFGAQAMDVFTNGGITFQDNNEGIEIALVQKNDLAGADFTLRVTDGVKNSALRMELTDYRNDPVILPLAGTGDDWINLTITCDATKFRIYKNGNLFLEKNTPVNLDMGGGGNLKVGTAGGYYYKGNIDDVFVYRAALTAEEVRQLYTQNMTR